MLWKKRLIFCALDGIDLLSGNESGILRYMGWLFSERKIAGNSLRNYLSSVTTAHTRIWKPITLTPVAVSADQQASTERKMLQDPTSTF